MAKANWQLVQILRLTADSIDKSCDYHWAHIGKCNCGHLAQTITGLSSQDIFQQARITRLEEWTEYANDYCPTSGKPLDELIRAMLDAGLERRDLHHLEYLSDACVLAHLPGGMRYLRRNQKADVSLYLRTWADMLESQMSPEEPDCVVKFPGCKAMGE